MKRYTTQRAAIEQVFRRHDRPLGVLEVLAAGRKKVPSLNQATVYRNLKDMVAAGQLKAINHPQRGTLYERSEKAHHHHFHCHSCNRVYELPGCALKQEKVVPDGFVLENHEIFLSGICDQCARQ
ncbi:MAG: transcriptional repressor [Desulfatitalea sp.]|nr:transcriptional repressor [Desulfatitalea sp.]